MTTVEFATTGPLFFPVTPFTADGTFNTELYIRLVQEGVAAGAGAVFAACGTGEFHALGAAEHAAVLQATKRAVNGTVPVFAGIGGPLGALPAQIQAAEAAEVDGLLLLPPYLVEGPQRGLVKYVADAAGLTSLPVIVYSRDNSVFDPGSIPALAAIANVMGYKDGAGDLESIGRATVIARQSTAASGKSFLFFNGMPAAETTVRAYSAAGVDLYSSSAFSFAPEISGAFYRAFCSGDDATLDLLLETFYFPLAEIRSRVPGYGVSLIKAGLRLRGVDAGSVRAPLVDPTPDDVEAMRVVLDAGLALVAGLTARVPEPVAS